MSNEAPVRDSAVQSVDRAITALEFLARNGEGRVSDVAAAIGVHKSTASRLLGVLLQRGLVELAGDRGRYRLGFGIVALAGAMGSRRDVTAQGRQICDGLVTQLGETVNLAVRQGDSAFNVHQSSGETAIGVNWVGRPTPLHATSSGKVLLAFLGGTADALIATLPLERFTASTVVDRETLRSQLSRARADGFAVTLGEYEEGLNAIAAPVYTVDGALVAALSVSGPAYRLPLEKLRSMAPAVIGAAAEISRRMGHFD